MESKSTVGYSLFVCKAFIKLFATVNLGRMKKRLACAGALAATAALTNGKEVITADGRRVRRKEPSQKIKLGINEDLCIFENFDDKWCL